MLSLYRPFNDLFRDDFWGRDSDLFARSWATRESFAPAVDVLENDKAYLLKVELPGMKPEEVDIQIENRVLSVKGERRSEHKDEGEGYRRVERRYGTFSRSFVVPEGVKTESIDAHMEHGVLTVTIPKPETATPRKLEIKSGNLVDKAKKKLFGKEQEKPQPSA